MPTLIGSPVAAAPAEPAAVPLGAAVVLSVVDAPGATAGGEHHRRSGCDASRVR